MLPFPAWALKPEMMRFGGVPISVAVPPRMQANERGMSILPGGSPWSSEARIAAGIRKESGTLFMKPERTGARAEIASIERAHSLQMMGEIFLHMRLTAPVI